MSYSSSSSSSCGCSKFLKLKDYISENALQRLNNYCKVLNDSFMFEYSSCDCDSSKEDNRTGKSWYEFSLNGFRGREFVLEDRALEGIIKKIDFFISKIRKNSGLELIFYK